MTSRPTGSGLERALRALHRLEDGVLVLLLSSMVLLASVQIALRNLFGVSIGWADPLLRLLVLWVGMLGALAASRGNRHITIDVVSRLLSERARHLVRGVMALFTSGVAGLVAYHGALFVAREFEYRSVAFYGLPAWVCEAIIPFSFGAIALRYLLLAVMEMTRLGPGEGAPP